MTNAKPTKPLLTAIPVPPLAVEGDGSYGSGKSVPGLVVLPKEVKVENSLCDYTPAKYITLLLTDLGVLTPSAVSDELIRLYQ